MQYALPFSTDRLIVGVHRRLLAAFGRPGNFVRLDPVSQMVLTMLSARTRNPIAQSVFLRIARYFSDWEKLAYTSSSKVERLINPVTFPERKAVFLPAALQQVMHYRGALNLDFLKAWSVEPARIWLERLPGVGPKTSAAILNFSPLHKRALVVDTAHCRAARRLGLVPPKTTIEKASRLLARQLPDYWTADDLEEHHMLMQRLGKIYCTNKNPACETCPLRALCSYAHEAQT